MTASAAPDAAREFIAALTDPDAQDVWEDGGFEVAQA